jgi:hypothetical protein
MEYQGQVVWGDHLRDRRRGHGHGVRASLVSAVFQIGSAMCNQVRAITDRVEGLKQSVASLLVRAQLVRDQMTAPGAVVASNGTRNEMVSNLMLAIRHLEDAENRLVKAKPPTPL